MKKFKNLSKKKKIFIIISSILVVLLVLGILFGPKLFKKEEPVKKKKPESKEVPKLKILDPNSKSRPFAVMINNNSAVWSYQSGLQKAYIVYELLVEGGITREMAVYKDSDVEKIASVRSSRHYFLDYAMENDAIYAHWGWSPQAQNDIYALGINNLNGLTYEGSYFFRDNTVRAAYEHRGYTTMESLKNAAEKIGYRTTTDKGVLLNYSVDPLDLSEAENVQDAKVVRIRFSNSYECEFIYDEANKVYIRKQNNQDMIDYTSKEPMTTKNIITYKNYYSYIYGDDKGRQNMSNIGSGEGYFITEGKAIPINWSKASRGEKTKYTLANGEELSVNDGNTYIEINPTSQSTTIEAELPA